MVGRASICAPAQVWHLSACEWHKKLRPQPKNNCGGLLLPGSLSGGASEPSAKCRLMASGLAGLPVRDNAWVRG
jgi:hypothetical protein